MRSSSSVVTPGRTCSATTCSTSAASAPALRAISMSAADLIETFLAITRPPDGRLAAGPGTGRRWKALGLLDADQQLADVRVAQLGIQLGKHADAHPVLGLGIDGAAERGAGHAQVLMHLLGDLDDAHVSDPYMVCIWIVSYCGHRARRKSDGASGRLGPAALGGGGLSRLPAPLAPALAEPRAASAAAAARHRTAPSRPARPGRTGTGADSRARAGASAPASGGPGCWN